MGQGLEAGSRTGSGLGLGLGSGIRGCVRVRLNYLLTERLSYGLLWKMGGARAKKLLLERCTVRSLDWCLLLSCYI